MADTLLTGRSEGHYLGLRMTADEFLGLPEDPAHYELVDGVVVMSPSPSYPHQKIIREILLQITEFLEGNPVGDVVMDIDVKLRDDLVYRPDVVYLRSEKAARCGTKITETPDLVVEVVSPDSRGYDAKTKRDDYEAAGVGEYWLIDPERRACQFFVLRDGRYVEARAEADAYTATIISGFRLNLARLRRMF